MNLDPGSIHVSLGACTCSGFDWHDASVIVNASLAPLVWVNDRLLELVEVPLVGGMALFLFQLLGVIEAVLAAALVVAVLLAANIAAAIANGATSLLDQLAMIAPTLGHALTDDAWGHFVGGELVAQFVLVIAALLIARRVLRGKWFAAAVCAIALVLVLRPLVSLSEALRVLGV